MWILPLQTKTDHKFRIKFTNIPNSEFSCEIQGCGDEKWRGLHEASTASDSDFEARDAQDESQWEKGEGLEGEKAIQFNSSSILRILSWGTRAESMSWASCWGGSIILSQSHKTHRSKTPGGGHFGHDEQADDDNADVDRDEDEENEWPV